MKIALALSFAFLAACGGSDKPAASPHDDSYTSTEHSGGSMNEGSPDGATPAKESKAAKPEGPELGVGRRRGPNRSF